MARTARDWDETNFPRAMGRPARGALEAAGYRRLEDLTRLSEVELLRMHGVGPKAIRVLREALQAKGLALAG